MVKLSDFMYGMIITIGVFAVLFAFTSKLVVNYGVSVPSNYNKTFMALSNMTPIESQTNELKTEALQENGSSSGFFGRIQDRFDISGLFFIRGLRALNVFPKTINVFTNMVDMILDNDVNLFGTATVSIRFIVVSLVIVALISVIVAALVKWWV